MIRVFFLIIIFLPIGSQAFDAGFLRFDLPENDWICKKNNNRHVCQPKASGDKTQAIIILNAKIAGPEDNLKLYSNHLAKPKMLTLKGQAPTPSKVIYTDAKMIGPQQWVESLHESSEVPDFYTLYLVTRSGDLSILLQLSASKQQQKKFNPTFKRLINSMRISPKFVAQVTKEAQKYTRNQPSANESLNTSPEINESANGFALSQKNLYLLGGLFVLLFGGLFVYYKKS